MMDEFTQKPWILRGYLQVGVCPCNLIHSRWRVSCEEKKSLYVEGQFVSIAPHLTNMGYIMTLLETICLWQTFSCHVHAFSPPSWMSLCRHHKSFVLRAMLHQCKLNHYGRWGSSKNMPPLKWEHVCSQMGLARFIGILMPFYSQSILIEVFML